MKIFELEDIKEILSESKISLPAEVVLAKMLDEGKAKELTSKSRVISAKKYSLDKGDLISYASQILNKGYFLCASGDIAEQANFPRLDEVFESLLGLAKKEIILIAPYASSEFMSDLQAVVDRKKELITIVTNSPKSRLAIKNQGDVIRKLQKMGFKVKLSSIDLHAKIYLFDRQIALIGSSNLSRHGFFDFYEVGTLIFGEDCSKLRKILKEIIRL